jgi:hypothetical protein
MQVISPIIDGDFRTANGGANLLYQADVADAGLARIKRAVEGRDESGKAE